jgi:serine/threonine protein kinase
VVRALSRAETSRWSGASRARAKAGWRPRNENRDSDAAIAPLPPAPLASSSPGAVAVPAPRFGPYKIGDKIGEGGLSIVHRAIDARDQLRGVRRGIALKRLHAGYATDPGLVEAFLCEAQIGRQLRHRNVARCYGWGKIDGTFYAAMELALGPTLADVIRQSRTAAGAIPTPVVVELGIQLCDALDHLHTRSPQIIHRDVQPDNLVVTAAGRLKLVDFGVAKVAARRQTQRGILKGTAAYLAPEYLDGELDARADLFSAGVILHELLAGRPLFAGNTDPLTLRNIRDKVVQPPSRWAPDVPLDLDDIVMTALARDPDQRWQNAAAMRFALIALAQGYGGRRAMVQLVVEWLGWAFERKPRRETQVVRLVDALEVAMEQEARACPWDAW